MGDTSVDINRKTLVNIRDNWKLEAKLEDEKYFFYTDEVKQILNGNKCFIIGRKGMGKTAISGYIADRNDPFVFSEHLSFKNFPFNVIYSMDDKEYTAPNQYITIWKYLIYNSVCKMMSRDNGVNSSIRSELDKLYPKEPIKELKRFFKHWTASEFGAQVLGNGGSIGGIKKTAEELSWNEKGDILEHIIESHAVTDSAYYILIDELDEEYRDFETPEQKKVYTYLLTSLFKAVQEIRMYFEGSAAKVYPVIFLRSDIYGFIRDSDKNKWTDNMIVLTWGKGNLYKMLSHRISVSSEGKIDESIAWSELFPDYVRMGNRQTKQMETFDYITRSTQLRPRDYVHYISECARLALQKDAVDIRPQIVKEADMGFSEYLKGEIIDEIFAVVPDIENVFSTLSQMRKQTFQPDEFIKSYSSQHGKSAAEGNEVLMQLFEHGVIGNQPSMKGQQIFKHQYPNALFNYQENVIIHRGLYKALQIF